MITVDHLTKRFSNRDVVKALTFNVSPGEVLGFLGPNGAGKSTTMKMISGFLTPTKGSVTLFGHDIQNETRQAQQLIGYLPEGAPSYGEMSVIDFLTFIAKVRGLKKPKTASDAAMQQLNLTDVANQRIETLSKGFKRRTGIAQAIIHDPAILILDEPTDGLDPNQKHQVRELINDLASDKVVIISTHILEEVEKLCTRTILISDGTLVADKTPSQLKQQSRYYGALTLQIKSDSDSDRQKIISQLNALNACSKLEIAKDNRDRYTLMAKSNMNLYQEFMTLSHKKTWLIEHLSVDSGRLDDVFRELTSKSQVAKL